MRKRDLKRRIRELEDQIDRLELEREIAALPAPVVPLTVRTGSTTWSPRCTCYDGMVTGPCLVHLTVWSTNT